jgi:predicted Fe-S protein YdhL (DUF1289 family)
MAEIDTTVSRARSDAPVMTPCVGICSTSIAGSVCRGCKRYAHEVIRWNSYSNAEQQIVWHRLEEFRITIVSNWFELVDTGLLKAQMTKQKIKFNPQLDARAWIYDLLRAGASQIEDITAYGLRVLPKSAGMTIPEINEVIEKNYLDLSEAHYLRYFDPSTFRSTLTADAQASSQTSIKNRAE